MTWGLWVVLFVAGYFAIFTLGMCLGYLGGKRAGYQQREEDYELARRRRMQDYHRVSSARPGTVPGRITRANISTNNSDMGQSHREF